MEAKNDSQVSFCNYLGVVKCAIPRTNPFCFPCSSPDYKGPWEHPMIPNPKYKADDQLHAVCAKGCTHVGFEIWQVKTGTMFDDIIVTDSLEEAQKYAEETFFKKKPGEVKMFDEAEEKKRKEEESSADDMDDMDGGFGDEF